MDITRIPPYWLSLIILTEILMTTFYYFRQILNESFFVLSLVLATVFSSFTLHATDLKMLAFVSDRSAASMVAGAHQYLSTQNENSESSLKNSINIRSVSQLNQLTNHQIQLLINQHQALVNAGVFGESVERLLTLNYPDQQTRLILNADRRLMRLHQDIQGGDFTKLSKPQMQTLMASLDKDDHLTALTQQQKQWSEFAYWLQARAYWQEEFSGQPVRRDKSVEDWR